MSSQLLYRGYQGSVEWDDGVLIVRVLHIRDFVSDECDNATQVQAVFQRLVDEYLEDCKRLGKEPDKPCKGTFNVRIDPALHRRAVMNASSAGRSLNELVADAISDYVAKLEMEASWRSGKGLLGGAMPLGKVIEHLMNQTLAIERAWEQTSIAKLRLPRVKSKAGIAEKYESAAEVLGAMRESKGRSAPWRQIN